MKRIERFQALAMHPFLNREFNAMPQKHRDECEAFINEHADLNDNDFIDKVNRWKMDQPEKRDKWYPNQWAMLIQSVDTVSMRKARRR